MKKFLLFVTTAFCLTGPAHANIVNLSVNPLGFLIGVGDFALDVRLTESLTVGALYTILDVDEALTTIDGNSVGARVRYHFGKALTESSWTLTGSWATIDADVTSSTVSIPPFFVGTTSSGTVEGSAISGIVGYAWVWSTFNIHFGLGVANYDVDVVQTVGSTVLTSPLDGTTLGLDFSFGLAF